MSALKEINFEYIFAVLKDPLKAQCRGTQIDSKLRKRPHKRCSDKEANQHPTVENNSVFIQSTKYFLPIR